MTRPHLLAAASAAVLIFLLARPAQAGTTREVTFASGGVELAATLMLPPGEGPFPGCVIVHGSGTSDRSNPWTSAWADALVQAGVAVLYPDKRGSGKSGGDWHTTGFDGLAADALAAAHVLQSEPRVDAARVGLMGFSQGGDVVPVAAARDGDVAFVIDISGSTVPIVEQVGDEIALMGEREGLSGDELAAVAKIHEKGAHYALTRRGWNEYAAALAAAKRAGLGETEAVAGFPTDPDDGAWSFLRTLGDFDPMESWGEVAAPILFVFGGQDTNVRVHKSIDRLADTPAMRARNYSVILLNANGHGLFRDDVLRFIAAWIRSGGKP